MSSNVPIGGSNNDITAPTPQNTPLQHAPISQGIARPSEMPNIAEDNELDVDDVNAALQSAGGAGLLEGLIQGKLSSIIGKSSGYIENLPVEVKRSIAALQGLQAKADEIQQAFKEEMFELERKVRLLDPAYMRSVLIYRRVFCSTLKKRNLFTLGGQKS